jgi:mRNA turnover protein 4
VQDVRDSIDEHDHLFLFSYENMRSNKFKDIRMHFRPTTATTDDNNKMMDEGVDDDDDDTKVVVPSRVMLGKNKLLQIALGKTPEDEYADNLRHVSKHISASVGLLFTSKPKDEVMQYFDNLVEPDFARAGTIAPRDVIITNDMLSNHPVSMVEQQFRKQGLPVKVDNGKIVLLDDQKEYKLCTEGEKLSPEKCKILSHFGIKVSEFRVKLICHWSQGEFEDLA